MTEIARISYSSETLHFRGILADVALSLLCSDLAERQGFYSGSRAELKPLRHIQCLSGLYYKIICLEKVAKYVIRNATL